MTKKEQSFILCMSLYLHYQSKIAKYMKAWLMADFWESLKSVPKRIISKLNILIIIKKKKKSEL